MSCKSPDHSNWITPVEKMGVAYAFVFLMLLLSFAAKSTTAEWRDSDEVTCFQRQKRSGECRRLLFHSTTSEDQEVRVRLDTCCKAKPDGLGGGFFTPYWEFTHRHRTLQSCRQCPDQRDGGWDQWTPWSFCTQTCGLNPVGKRSRTRRCISPLPLLGGRLCRHQTGEGRSSREEDVEDCNATPCRVNGAWTDWQQQGACNGGCGTGEQRWTRTCTNPAPQHGGQGCSGPAERVTTCPLPNTCESSAVADPAWRPWTEFGPCSAACGQGSRERRRVCSRRGVMGGFDCDGAFKEEHYCFVRTCGQGTPVQCGGGGLNDGGSGQGSGGGQRDGINDDEDNVGRGSGGHAADAVLGSGSGDGSGGRRNSRPLSRNDLEKCCRNEGLAYNGNGQCCGAADSPRNCPPDDEECNQSSGSGELADDDVARMDASGDGGSGRRRRRRSENCRPIAGFVGRKRRSVLSLLLADMSRSKKAVKVSVQSRERRHPESVDDEFEDDDFTVG